jgi:hypothetical protein
LHKEKKKLLEGQCAALIVKLDNVDLFKIKKDQNSVKTQVRVMGLE